LGQQVCVREAKKSRENPYTLESDILFGDITSNRHVLVIGTTVFFTDPH